MVIFDLLNNLVPSNWKFVKNWFIHNFFNKTKAILDLISLFYWSHLNIFSLLSIFCWFTKRASGKNHWSYLNKHSLSYSWWFIILLSNTEYLPHRSHYMAYHQCVFSGDLQGNFSVKSFYHIGHIYRASPHCILSDDLQK